MSPKRIPTVVASTPPSGEPPEILSSRIRPQSMAVIEALEPRVVCAVNIGAGLASATVLSGAQVNEIVNGLEDLGKLGNALEASGVLAQDLEGLGLSFGELFNFGTNNGRDGFLGDAFRDKVDALFQGALPAGPTVTQINAWLNTSPAAGTTGDYTGVTWSLAQGGEYPGAHPFEWEVTVAGARTTENNLVPGANAAAAGIAFTTAPKVSTDASASIKFSFGLTNTNDFFATLGNLTFTVDGTTPVAGMTGAVSYTVAGTPHAYTLATGSTVELGAQFANVAITGAGSADGKWTRPELTSLAGSLAATDFTVGTTTDEGLHAKINVTKPGGTPVQMRLDDTAVLDANAPTITHDVALDGFVAGGNVTNIFQRIQTAGANLDTNPLRGLNLPGIGTALDDIEGLPAFADLLSLADAASTYMSAGGNPTFRGLAAALNSSLSAQLSAAAVTVGSSAFTVGFDPATSSMALHFTLDTGTLAKTFDFDRLGSAASQAGLSFDRDETLQIPATVRAQSEFGFGLDLTQAAGTASSLFFTSTGISTTLGFDVTGIDLSATLGPVTADIVDGEVHGSAALALKITDATDDGRYTLAELQNGSEVTFGFTPTGTFEANLPLDIQLAGATFVNPRIRLATPNIFTQLPSVDTTTANFDKIFNLGKVGPEAMLDLIVAAGDWASNFRNAPLFNVNVPFLDANVGDAFDFGLLFTKNLRDKLQSDLSYVALKGDFAAFTLPSTVPLVLSDGASSQAITLPAGTYATKTDLITALNTLLGTTSKFKAEAHGDNGVRIAAKNANDVPDFSLLGATYQLKAIGFVKSDTVVTSEVTLPLAVPTTGKISADASFKLAIDGGTPVTITLAKTATNDNADAAALATDLDTALASYGIDATAAGGKLKLTRPDGKSFMVEGVSGTSFQQLGIENRSGAGITSAGSTLQSGLTYQTLTDMVPVLLTALGIPDDGDGNPSNDPIRARYDIATETIILHFEHEFLAPSLSLPVGFEFDLANDWANLRTVDAQGNPTSPTLTLTPTLGGSFDLGISLADDSTFEELSITAPTGFAPNGYGEKLDDTPQANTVPDSDNALPWDGKLAADAVFKISFDDGVERTLTIPKSATTTNDSAAQLLVDVKAAIAATPGLVGKLDARVIAKQGGTSDRIEFFTLEQAGNYQIRNLRIATASPGETMGFTADQLELSSAPAVAVLNASQATLDYSPPTDATFSISLDGGAPITFTATAANMAENTSMAHLLADLNAAIAATALAGHVKAIRYGVGSQLQFIAEEGVRQMSLTPADTAAQTTLNFGTKAIVTRSRGGDFFIDNASFDASATLSLPNLRVAAQLGFIGITTTGLDGSVTIDTNVQLADGAQTRFELSELLGRVGDGTIGDIVTTDFTGSAVATMSGLQVDAGILSVGSSAAVALNATNIFAAGGPNFAVTFTGFDKTKLVNFSHASWDEIYNGIKLGVEFLTKTEQFSFLADTKIPLINVSVAEIFSYTDQLVAAVGELKTDPHTVLGKVEHKIEELLGIRDADFTLSLDADSVLRIHLDISTSFSATYGLDVDLATLASYTNNVIPADLLALGGFLDASAEGSLQFGAYAGLALDLGLDFSSSATPSILVYPTSGVDLGLRLTGQNLNISASLGPVGFEITDGTVIFDADGIYDANGDDLQDNDFAKVHFGPLNTITDLPGTIAAIAGGTPLSTYFGPTFTGKIIATLPGAITSDIGSIDLPSPIGITVADVTKLFSSDPLVRKDSVVLDLPSMSDLLPEVPGLMQLLRDPAILLDGVDSGLGLISKLLAGKTATKLPLIGDQLRAGSGFIEDFRAGFIADLTAKLRGSGDNLLATMQQGMFDLFAADTDGATGLALGFLQDYNGDGSVTKDDVVLSFRKVDGSIWKGDLDLVEEPGEDPFSAQDAVQFNLHLGKSITLGADLDIDWGLPGLDLDIDGSPEITAGWDLFLGFGVSISDFFYLDAEPPTAFTGSGVTLAKGAAVTHELSLHFDAVLTPESTTPLALEGRLFFLQLNAVDQEVDGEFSHVGGAFYVDLHDPSATKDGRTTIKELFSRGAEKPIVAGLEAEAKINLGLTASVEGSTAIPRILADFNLDWTFTLGQPVVAPSVSFTNVHLDVGSFVSDFLKPIVNKVNEIISPFDPVLDALQTRIPVLSDLMGRDYTVLDLAVQFGNVDRRFVDAVLGIRSLVADIAALPDGVNILIPIGDLAGLGSAFTTKDGAAKVNTSSTGTTQIDFGSGLNAQQQQYKTAFTKSTTLSGGGFGFPILKPANAFKLLLGQEATLVTYDIPRLTASMSMSRTFPIWGPLVGKFSGSITAYADFAVGFDTKGFNTYRTSGDVVDILDGFYVSDRANADGTGADVYEAGFTGRIGIGGAINLAVVEAGIEGFFELRADLDLKDPNDDGKIRGSEIIALLTHPNGYGPLNLGSIRLSGDVGARAYVDFWAPFKWYNAWEWEFARITLFDKTFSAPDVTPDLGTLSGSTLTLNAGATANQRDFISTSDVGEEFVVSGTGKDIRVTFSNTGTWQDFTNVDRIVINGGKGNDRLIVGAGVTTAITFDGGEGDDYFEGGAGNDIIIGGLGNDTLIGGGGSNTLDGGEGADIITGGANADIIIGGLGDDVLNGGGGADIYKFANDWGRDVFDGNQTGTGKFDFSAATKDLTLNISATGAQGSSGNNAISFDSTAPYITNVLGGSGNDVATIAATGAATVTVDGNGGSDQYIVSFGRLSSPLSIADTGSGLNDSDTVTIRPLTNGYTLDVHDLYVTGTKTGLATTQRADFTAGIENLTADAKTTGGSTVRIAEAISLPGDVRLIGSQVVIQNTIDAGNLRIESGQGVDIAANVNAHNNGGVTVIVTSGTITLSQDVMSSAGTGFTGDGAGLVHLFTNGGSIVTGGIASDHGRVLAAAGSLLVRGTNGSIGTLDTPVYSTVATLAASTTGSGLVNIHESDGVIIGSVASINGVKTTGGMFNVFNDAGELLIASPIELGGGDGTLTSDRIEIDARINSPGGTLFLQPEGVLTVMSIGDGVTGAFALDQSEINHLGNGFDSIRIGQPTGRNLINLGNASFTDPVLLQNPLLGGHIDQTGVVNVTDGGSFTILGSGHTTELSNQNVAGNIDIIDSATVHEGTTVTLTSTGGAININFNLDGTAGGADETLVLNAAGNVVIKGAIGSAAQLGTLRITGATNITFEGSVNVKHLILDAGSTFTADGAFNAVDIALNGVTNATFHSGVTLTTGLTTTGSTLTNAIFEGQVTAPSITLTAKQLVDFYQLVDVTTTLNVTTTNPTGDITFRQQVDAHGGNIVVQAPDDITFIGPVAGHDLTVTGADALALQATTELDGAFLQSAGTGLSTFAQFTASTASIASAGVILGGVTTLNGAAGLVVNVGTGTFSATNAVSAPGGPLNVTARTISFQGTVAAGSATLAGTENITVANASSFAVAGALSATTTSATLGEIKFSGPVDIGTSATFNTPRALTFQNTLEVTGGLTVQAAASAAYQGAVTIGGTFSQQPGVQGATSFTSTLNAGVLDLRSGSFSFSGDVMSSGNATISTSTGGITTTGNVSAAGVLTANAATNLALQGATAAYSVALTAAGTITVGAGGLTTAASPTAGGIQITTTGPVAGNSVTLNGTVNAKGALGISATQGVLASNTIGAGSLNASGTALTFNSPVTTTGAATFNTTGALNIAAGLNAGGVLTVASAASTTFGDSVTAASASVTATNSINISVGGLTGTSGAISLNTTASGAGNAITALGVIDAATSLNITTPRGVSLNVIEAASLTADAASINLPAAVTTTGGTTLTAAAGGNITAGSTINAGGALTVTRAKAVTFGSLVSAGSVAIGQGGADSIETVAIGVGGMTATNDLRIRTTVGGAGNGITTQGPLIAGSAATLALDSARGVDVSGTLNAGNLAVNGTTVTLRSPINVANNVTLASSGALSVDRDLIVAGNVAVTQAGALTFGGALQAANLSIANTQSAGFTGAVTIVQNASIGLLGNLTTSSAFNVGGALNIPSGAALTLNSAVTAGSAAIGGATLVTGGDVTTTVGGLAITTSGDVTVAGKTTVAQTLSILGSDDVTLTGAVVARDFTLSATSFTAGGALTTNVGAASFNTTGNVRIVGAASAATSLTVTDALNAIFEGQVTAPSITVTARQLADFFQLVDVSTTLSVAATNPTGDIVFRQQVDAHSGNIVVQSPDDITFTGPIAGHNLTVASADALALQANVNLTGAFVQSAGTGISTFAQFTAGSANITSAGVILGGATTLNGASGLVANVGTGAFSAANAVSAPNGPLNLTARTITFQGSVAAGSATLAGTESITVANTSSFALTGALNATTTSTTLGEIKFTGPVDIDTNATFNTPRALTFQNTLNADGALIVQAASSAQYQGAVTVGGVFTQQAGVIGAATFSSTVQAGSLALQAGSLSFSGDVASLGAAGLTANTGSITANGNISAAGSLTATAATNLTLQGATAAHSMALNAVSTVTVGAGGLSTAASPTTGNIQITTTGAVAGNSVTLNGPVDAKGIFGINAARGVIAAADIRAGVVNVVTPRDVSLNVIEAGSVNIDAQSINLPAAVNTTGGIMLSAAASGNIVAGSTIMAGGAFQISRAKAITTNGLITANSVAVGQGGTDSIETVAIGVGGMTAANDLRIRTTVAGSGNGITAQGALTAGSAATLALESVRGVDVSGTLTAGDVTLSGLPLTIRGAVHAGDDVTLHSAGTISISSDVVAADDVVVTQAGALSFGAKLTAADLLVSNTDSATFIGQVALSGTASLALSGDLTTNAPFAATDSITVSTVRDVSFGGLVTSATVNIGGTSARGISVNAAGIATSGALTLRSTDAAGALNLNGPLTATSGAVTLSALGAVTSTATISGDSIAVASPAMALGGALVSDGAGTTGSIALDSTVANSGSLILGGVVTSTGSLLVGTNAAPQSASLNGALNIGQDLIARASETVSAGAQISVTRDASFLTTSTTAGEVRLNGSLTTGRDLLLNTPRNATFLAPVTVGRDATVTNAAALQFDGALNVSGALAQLAGSVSSRFASISAASIAIDTPTIAVTNAVTATSGGATFTAGGAGKVTVGGNTNVAGALSVTRADEVILTGNVTAASVNAGSTNVRTMTFGTNLNATAGGVTLRAANGPISVLGTLNASGALSIPSGTVITLNGAVTAASATLAGGALVTGSDLTMTTGGFAVTTTGDVNIAGKTTVAQTLSIIGSDDVTLAGAVVARDFTLNATSFLAGGAFTTNVGDATFLTSGNIRVVGLASVAEDLTVTNALNATFQGQVAVTGAFTQVNGGGATRFEGVTNAASLNIRTAQQIFAGSTFRANGGDMRLEADEIDFFGGTNAVQGSAILTLRPYNAGASIDVGSPTPTGLLDLSDVDLNALQDGFSHIVIGRAEDGTGAMLIGSSSFKDNVAFHAGSITVESNTLVGQVVTTLESIALTARTGSILFNDDVFGTDATLAARDNITINNKVEVADFITLTAGTDGSGSITLNGSMATSAGNGFVTLDAGSASGGIALAGNITTTDVTLTALNGAIIQTGGRTTAPEVLALAKSGITLLTTADHISARVTGTGDLNISDANLSDTHFLNLGSQTDVNDGLFTADGDITVIADQSVNAYRVQANGAVNIESGGEVYVDNIIGAPVSVTGTILIDEDRTTNGEQIRFDGNIRLLRDITLTSNGGDIIITGRVNGTAGQHYSLTFNAGGGDVSVGGQIGNVTPVSFLQVNDAGVFSLGGGARVEGDIELHADSIALTAPAGSITSTGGGQLRLLPNASNAAIDLGAPSGGTAAFSLNDAELAAFGNGFGLIQIGQRDATHAVKIESARLLDDVEINADTVTLQKSSVTQGVNGLSAVNGADDNDITINARTAFTQESRAALAAGRNGNITITADSIALDPKSRGLVRGFGELLLQPFTPTRDMTLGGAGAGFEITADEFGALGDTFSKVTVGRADSSGLVSITSSLSFRDNTLLRTPLAGGSVTIGSGTAATTVQTVGRADNLRIESAGGIIVDGSVKTAGRGSLELLADYDGDGDGDLRIGQNLGKPNKSVTIGSDFGAIRLQGENIALGLVIPTLKDAGIVNVTSLGGNISVRSNVDGDTDGGLTFRHAKSGVKTGGLVEISSANHAGAADLGDGLISGKRGVDFRGFESLTANATKMKSDTLIAIEAMRATLMAKSAFTSLAEIQIFGNAATGILAVEKGATLSAIKSILLDAADVQRDPAAIVKAKTVTIHEL